MDLNKIFRCKSIILYTLISFTLCSCGGGRSGASSSDAHGNIAGDLNKTSLKSSNPVVIKYTEDIFNREILDVTTANNPLSLAGSMGINLAQASGNSLFSFSESSFRPLYATMDSALRDKNALLNDILSSLKIADTNLGGTGTLEIFSKKILSSPYSNLAHIDDLYLFYLKNNVFPSANINQVDYISQGAKNYCKSIGATNSASVLPMNLLSGITISSAYGEIVRGDSSAKSQLEDLKKMILPPKLSTDVINNGNLMFDINQYNAKVIDYQVKQIYALKELYYLQIMQSSLWNQRNDGCRNQLDKAPDFSNISDMPNLDGSSEALDAAIAAITKQYSYNLERILITGLWKNLLITEADMVKYLNKDITASSYPLLDEDTFSPLTETPLKVGKCTISSLKFDGQNNLLSKSFKIDDSNNQDGILTIQGTCISRDTFVTDYKKIILKNYTMSFPYQLDSQSKITNWANQIGFDYNEDKWFINNSRLGSTYFKVKGTNPLVRLVGNETDINTQLPLLRFSDTIYEHYPVSDNDHMWYPGQINVTRDSVTQPMIQFINRVYGTDEVKNAYQLFPTSTPCINGCPLGTLNTQLIMHNGTRKELKSTINYLGQKIGYKEIFIANSGSHLFGVRLIFTLSNEQTSGVHSSAKNNDAPINQYIELMCLTDDCKLQSPDFGITTQVLDFNDGTHIILSLTGKNDYFGDNQYAQAKLNSYNKDKYGPPRKFFWSITSSNSPIKSNMELPVIKDKLPADYNKWIENYDSSNNDYMTAVLVIGGMVLFTGLVISIAMLLSQRQPDPKNPDKIKPIEIAYSPDLKFRVIFDLNDFKLKIQSMKDGVGTDACYITSVPGATRVVFADGQVRIYQGSTLAWSNQLEYSKNNRSLQWVTDTFAKLVIDNSGVLMIKPSDENKNLGFKPQKSSNKNENVLWETYPVAGVEMCASSLDSSIVKNEVEKNNGKVSPDEYSDFKPNDYTLSGTSNFSYPRDSLEDIPVGRYGLKTVLITNVSNGVISLKNLKTDLTKNSAELYISDDKRYTTCALNGSTSLNAGESCRVAYRFDPSNEGQNFSFNVSADIVTSKGVDAKGSTMYIPVYSRIPTDKPKGDYLNKCEKITWLEGNLSAVCGFKKPRSSLLYFKQCKRNPIPTDVTVKDGMLVCVSPL